MRRRRGRGSTGSKIFIIKNRDGGGRKRRGRNESIVVHKVVRAFERKVGMINLFILNNIDCLSTVIILLYLIKINKQ